MNPRTEDAPADHVRMIRAIGHALEHVKPRSIVAISDYGAHHRKEPALHSLFTCLSKG